MISIATALMLSSFSGLQPIAFTMGEPVEIRYTPIPADAQRCGLKMEQVDNALRSALKYNGIKISQKSPYVVNVRTATPMHCKVRYEIIIFRSESPDQLMCIRDNRQSLITLAEIPNRLRDEIASCDKEINENFQLEWGKAMWGL